MQKHVSILAALQIGLSIFGLFIGTVICAIIFGAGIISHDPEAMIILSSVGSVIAFFLFSTSILGIIGGIGLLKYKNWARILILILSAIDLINIPIGTALAIYSFWVLIQDETVQLFTTQT